MDGQSATSQFLCGLCRVIAGILSVRVQVCDFCNKKKSSLTVGVLAERNSNAVGLW